MNKSQPKNGARRSTDVKNCGEAVESFAPVTVESSKTAIEAAEIMARHKVGCLPVVDNGKLIGIVSERDIVVKVVGFGSDCASVSVKAIMTMAPKTVRHDQPIEDAMKVMNDYDFRHVPVMLGEGVLGVISAKSLLRLLAEK